MTLQELKDEIDQLVAQQGEIVLDYQVMAAYDFGDRCRTEALTCFDELKVVRPRKSAYSDTGLTMPHDSEKNGTQETENADQELVVALV